HSPVALRRAASLCDGWIAAGAYSEAEAWTHLDSLRKALAKAGRLDEPFVTYLSLAERPDPDLYRRFEDAGVTDMVCAPWMFAPTPAGASPDEVLAARIGACEWFAEHIIAKMV
ncbi:MAG TPA: hypothetical protein VIJ60_02235, partial [Acidimicrobiales bacterium]